MLTERWRRKVSRVRLRTLGASAQGHAASAPAAIGAKIADLCAAGKLDAESIDAHVRGASSLGEWHLGVWMSVEGPMSRGSSTAVIARGSAPFRYVFLTAETDSVRAPISALGVVASHRRGFALPERAYVWNNCLRERGSVMIYG